MRQSKYEEQIRNIARIYFVSLRSLKFQLISSGEKDEFNPFYKYYLDVEEAFSRLSEEKKRLITREYFYDAYKGWWTSDYKKRQFSRLKKIAVREFVEVFYEIH